MNRRYSLILLADASGVPIASLRPRLGLSGSDWIHARDEGVGERAADRYAVKLGLTPWQVWPDWADDALAAALADDAERQERTRRIARDSARKRYWEDESIRQRRLDNARRYRDENREYVLADQRRRRARDLEARRLADRAYYERNRDQILARKRERDARRREAA